MTKKHTPTPWHAAPSGINMRSNSLSFGIVQKDKPNLIAGLYADVAGGEDVSEANAAFIVKACNTHDELVACLEGVHFVFEHIEVHEKHNATRLAIRAILAKVSK